MGSTRNWPPVYAAICFALRRTRTAEGALQLLGRHDAVVEGEHFIAHELVILMALAGHEDGIARACERDGGRDGTTAIGLHGEALGVFHTRHDIGDDGIGLLVTRVVARHHGVVGAQRRSSHDGALGGVAVAAAAEDDDGASV